MNSNDSIRATELARQVVLHRIAHYNQILIQFSSNWLRIQIYLTVVGLISLIGLGIVPSIVITTLIFFVVVISSYNYVTSKDIYHCPSLAGFFASLHGGKPIILTPLIEKEELWTTLISQVAAQSDANINFPTKDLVIKTIVALKTKSIELYNTNQLRELGSQ